MNLFKKFTHTNQVTWSETELSGTLPSEPECIQEGPSVVQGDHGALKSWISFSCLCLLTK